MRGREVSGGDQVSKTGEGVAEEEPRTDRESILRREILFRKNCSLCHDPASHDPASRKTVVGPGLSGVLKNPDLPVSERKATAENVRRQFKSPFRNMPSFAHLSDNQVKDIIAYLNTL
jgi:mono/diheme cytochrome c family protein